MATQIQNLLLLLFVPAGVLLLLDGVNPQTGNPGSGKEKYYLRYNKDGIFKDLLATEEHFRNVQNNLGIDREGSLNCCVKHLAVAEGHADEAISHSLMAVNEDTSQKFVGLRNNIRGLRHDLQGGKVTVEGGIKRTRGIRREFEGFNADYDISACAACEVT